MRRRLCLTGAESTGKTVLSRRLAARMGAALVPEYGREWAETFGTDFTSRALIAIAQGHDRRRRAFAAARPRLIVEDTDIVTTAAWMRMLHGRRDPVLDAIPASADLYLLFSPDVPWIADGTRCFPGPERQRFHAALVDELARRGIVPISIGGDWAMREAAAMAAARRLIG